MSSLGSTPKLRTNCRMLLMKEKASQEDQRKRQKMMNSPRSHNSTRSPGLLPPSVTAPTASVFRKNELDDPDFSHLRHSHLEPILSDDFTPADSINTPYSLTPSSMTTSVSEYDTLFEDINEIVEKESHINNSFSEKNDHGKNNNSNNNNNNNNKTRGHSKAPLKTSSSCPSIRPSARLTLPSKLDPSDFPDIDAYKKEKHNIVEKKRRYKINDCIQELADLLPTTYDVDLNMKKGYILEKSVEYIQELKKVSEGRSETEGRVKELERENRQLHLELQTLRRSQEAALRRQQQQQQQQQHQLQQQQLFLVSPNFQSQQQTSPHSNPIILALGDNFLNNNNNNNNGNSTNHHHSRHHQQQQLQQQQQQQQHSYNQSLFASDFSNPEAMDQGCLTGLLDADTLMSNLQVSNELTDTDRQELSSFINLEEISGEDILMSDFGAFPQSCDQF